MALFFCQLATKFWPFGTCFKPHTSGFYERAVYDEFLALANTTPEHLSP
jgi:hypothetical protein